MPPRTAAPAKPAESHLTEDELAVRLNLTTEAVKAWRKQNRGPDWLKGDGRAGTVRYPVAWVVEWENSRRHRMASA